MSIENWSTFTYPGQRCDKQEAICLILKEALVNKNKETNHSAGWAVSIWGVALEEWRKKFLEDDFRCHMKDQFSIREF